MKLRNEFRRQHRPTASIKAGPAVRAIRFDRNWHPELVCATQGAEAHAQQRLVLLQADEKTKHELQLEKEKLAEKIYSQLQIEDKKLSRTKKACHLFFSLSEFPVRSGEHFVLCEFGLQNGSGLLFFVPPGNHKLRYAISEYEMVGNGMSARPKSHGVSVYETLDLPASSVVELTFRLENEAENCLAIVELKDEHETTLFQKTYKYEERTLSGEFPGSRSGDDVFRPGQIFRFGGAERSSKDTYKISSRADSIYCLSFRYEILSPESPKFLRANDVYYQLGSGVSPSPEFESRFKADDGTGRLFKITSD